MMPEPLEYYCDLHRHLVCAPYSIENLHRMGQELGIDKCWFSAGNSKSKKRTGKVGFAHYDMPKLRVIEIRAKCKVVSSKQILEIVLGYHKQAGKVTGRQLGLF